MKVSNDGDGESDGDQTKIMIMLSFAKEYIPPGEYGLQMPGSRWVWVRPRRDLHAAHPPIKAYLTHAGQLPLTPLGNLAEGEKVRNVLRITLFEKTH